MRISIHFSLVSRGTSDFPIRMRLSYDGLRLDVRTGYVCPPDKWDPGSMRMKPNATNRYGQRGSDINRNLSKQEETVLSILARYDLDGKVPEPTVLKSDIGIALGRSSKAELSPKSLSVSDLVRPFLDGYGKEASWTSGSASVYDSTMRHISSLAVGSVLLSDLTMDDMASFVQELWDEGLANRTVVRFLTMFKTMLRWGRRNGYYHGTLPEDFQPKIKGNGLYVVNYLEWEEFKALFDLDISDGTIKPIVRDCFCFCCCTGLRVSDALRLTWHDLHLDAGTPYLSISAKKTLKPTTIELNKYAVAIAERCRSYSNGSRYVFREISYRHYNELLSVVAKMAGLDRVVRKMSFVGNRATETTEEVYNAISSHWGRHTFIVRALSIGIPTHVIMSWTGHSSVDSMKPYIAIAESSKAENMSKFDSD